MISKLSKYMDHMDQKIMYGNLMLQSETRLIVVEKV